MLVVAGTVIASNQIFDSKNNLSPIERLWTHLIKVWIQLIVLDHCRAHQLKNWSSSRVDWRSWIISLAWSKVNDPATSNTASRISSFQIENHGELTLIISNYFLFAPIALYRRFIFPFHTRGKQHCSYKTRGEGERARLSSLVNLNLN